MSSADLASLRIAEDRVEWAVICDASKPCIIERVARRVKASATRIRAESDHYHPSCAPHRVVSRRVITTEWAEADE